MQRLAAFPYRGGKFHLAPKIIKLFPSHKVYVEVFGGAASVLLAKPPSPIEVYNDDNGLLVNLFETVRNRPQLLIDKTRTILYSRELYETWREELTMDLVLRDPLEAAVKTYYCLLSSFIGDPTKGWAFQRKGRDGGPNRWTNIAQRILLLTERLRHVAIDKLDYADCIKNWDTEKTLFFLDPPYLSTVSKGWYGNGFDFEDHAELQKLLSGAKARWLMTLDDVPRLRELYRDWVVHPITSKLSSQKVCEGGKRVELKQVLVSNYHYQYPESLLHW